MASPSRTTRGRMDQGQKTKRRRWLTSFREGTNMTTNNGQALGFSPSLLFSSSFFSSYFVACVRGVSVSRSCRTTGFVGNEKAQQGKGRWTDLFCRKKTEATPVDSRTVAALLFTFLFFFNLATSVDLCPNSKRSAWVVQWNAFDELYASIVSACQSSDVKTNILFATH
jgi:hypothetical protein